MPLGLGNNLIRSGGAGNPDGLSLDLQFAADKTFSKPSSLAASETAITSRKGPSATFLRSSGATEVGPDGLIRYAPENVLAWSNNVENASWSKTNIVFTSVASSDSRFTQINQIAASTAVGLHRVSPQILHTPAQVGQVQTLSFFIRKTQLGAYSFAYLNCSQAGISASINLDTAGVNSGSGNVTATITSGGWIKVVGTGLVTHSSSSVLIQINRTNAIVDDSFAGDGVSGFQVANFQLERHTSARAYIPTTTAAVYAARFDHDPITLACNGLLIEESRENFVSFSDAFNDASWGKASIGIGAAVVTANQGTAPNGQNTADRIVFAASTAAEQQGHVWKAAAGGDKYAGSSVTASVWLRTETGTATVYLSVVQSPAGGISGGTYTACSVTTTWTRFKVTRTLTSTTLAYFAIGPDTRVSFANQPPALGATVLVWGAQLEAGAFPTSYIPTTIGSVVRSADVCSITGSNFTGMYNQTEGSVLVDAFTPALGAKTIVSLFANVSYNMALFTDTSAVKFFVNDGGNQVDMSSGPPIIPNTAFKLACAYKLNDFAITKNGVTPQTDTSGTVPTVDTMRVGSGPSGNTMCGCVSSLRYYKKRLPNAKLQSLTI